MLAHVRARQPGSPGALRPLAQRLRELLVVSEESTRVRSRNELGSEAVLASSTGAPQAIASSGVKPSSSGFSTRRP